MALTCQFSRQIINFSFPTLGNRSEQQISSQAHHNLSGTISVNMNRQVFYNSPLTISALLHHLGTKGPEYSTNPYTPPSLEVLSEMIQAFRISYHGRTKPGIPQKYNPPPTYSLLTWWRVQRTHVQDAMPCDLAHARAILPICLL